MRLLLLFLFINVEPEVQRSKSWLKLVGKPGHKISFYCNIFFTAIFIFSFTHDSFLYSLFFVGNLLRLGQSYCTFFGLIKCKKALSISCRGHLLYVIQF